jgi:multidrug resistance efflux pump
MRSNWTWRLAIAGLALLTLSTGGALWALRAPAGGNTQGSGTSAAGERGVVCIGHADVEGGVAALTPAQPGRVVEILTQEDQAVKAGTPLLRLDDTPARLAVQQAEADLRAARAQLGEAQKLPRQHGFRLIEQRQAVAAAQARAAAARQVRTRYENLRKGGQAAAEEAEAAAQRAREAEAAVVAEENKLHELELVDPAQAIVRAEADVAAKKARLAQANYALSQYTLQAPADGKVLRVLVSKGELLVAQPRQAAIQFCPDAPRIVRAEVEQEFADRVAVGQVATVVDDGNQARKWRGKVVRVSDWYTHRRSIIQEPLQMNDVRTLECIVQLEAGPAPRIGQRVRVQIAPVPPAQ